jgi:hypothetical protein
MQSKKNFFYFPNKLQIIRKFKVLRSIVDEVVLCKLIRCIEILRYRNITSLYFHAFYCFTVPWTC